MKEVTYILPKRVSDSVMSISSLDLKYRSEFRLGIGRPQLHRTIVSNTDEFIYRDPQGRLQEGTPGCLVYVEW